MENSSRFQFKEFMKVPKNLIAPYYGTDRLMGQTYSILVETIVENIVRRLISKRIPIMDTALALTLGKPFEGMFYFGEAPDTIGNEDFLDSVMAGAQTTPGQFVGQYILETCKKGFHFPSGDFVDMLVVLASKALSRPTMGFAAGFLPQNLNDQLAVVNAVLTSQKRIGFSSFMDVSKSAGGKDLRRRL